MNVSCCVLLYVHRNHKLIRDEGGEGGGGGLIIKVLKTDLLVIRSQTLPKSQNDPTA